MTDDRSEDATYENESSTVTIPLKEYDKLREKQKYITDKDMISVIDKIFWKNVIISHNYCEPYVFWNIFTTFMKNSRIR